MSLREALKHFRYIFSGIFSIIRTGCENLCFVSQRKNERPIFSEIKLRFIYRQHKSIYEKMFKKYVNIRVVCSRLGLSGDLIQVSRTCKLALKRLN